MDTRHSGDLPARLESVRRRFEQWRATRQRRTRIPDTLWASAVRVAGTFGISRTARVLRVNPNRLKRRLGDKLVTSAPELEGESRWMAPIAWLSDSMKEWSSWWYKRCGSVITHQNHDRRTERCYTLESTSTASS
jgi:hypothetical protein